MSAQVWQIAQHARFGGRRRHPDADEIARRIRRWRRRRALERTLLWVVGVAGVAAATWQVMR